MAAFTSRTLPAEAPGFVPVGPAISDAAGITRVPVDIRLGAEAEPLLSCLPSDRSDYWKTVLLEGPAALAPNLRGRPGAVSHEGHAWPLLISDRIEDASYPCSLYGQYVRYPREELGLVPSAATRLAARIGLFLTGGLLRIAKVDRTVQWSSWMMSTNLHGPGLKESVADVTRALVRRFPRHAVLVKNINCFEDPALPAAFANEGYDLVTSRQIYFFDGRSGDFLKKDTVKRDRKALDKLAGYRQVAHADFTGADVPRIAELYRMLYVDKHSRLNPRYTERFVAGALRGGWLEFSGLRHESGRLDGVFGCFNSGDVMSTPFIGRDTSVPGEDGMYRHLVSMLLRTVESRRALLNYSSGAGDFKRRRGGVPVIEFNALYYRHLSPARSAALRLFGHTVNRFARPFLEKNQL